MGALRAYLDELAHRHTWETRWSLTDTEVDVCPCGATRRVEPDDDDLALTSG